MKYFVYYIIALFFLVSCLDGSQTPFDGNFTQADPKKELPFEKLVGTYELDKDSKRRYSIKDSSSLIIKIKSDTTFFTEKYISPFNRKIEFKDIKSKLYYINNYNDKKMPFIKLSLPIKDFTNGGGG